MPSLVKPEEITTGDALYVFSPSEVLEYYGVVTNVNLDEHGYQTVYLDLGGVEFAIGTGGSLGDTWTANKGNHEWFVEFA